jgi:predicted  nucleic acid-binding Zn-ribbon protein
MSAPLAEALRRLGLPLDETIDDGDLGEAYRRAARENHPDGAPDEEREQRGEAMRAINAARDLVRSSLELLAERAYTELSERENGSPAPAWWEDAIFEDPSGLGVRWNPGAVRIPWRQRFEQARLALCIAVGDTVTVESEGMLSLARVEAFDSSVRVSLRTSWGGLPVELRRIGVEVRLPDGAVTTVDAADVRAAGWHCPVCGRTSTLGEPRERPCPRCIRRSRIDYGRWDDLGRRWRRLQRRLRELDRVATVFSPRRSPAFRDVDDGLIDARGRVDSLNATVEAFDAALAASEASVAEAEARVARTRTPGGAERRRRERAKYAAEAKRVRAARDRTASVLDEQRVRVVELDRERTRLERELRARHEANERARRNSQAKRDAERDAALKELRTVEIELGAVAPDAIALLEGFEAWRQAPDKWLIDEAAT